MPKKNVRKFVEIEDEAEYLAPQPERTVGEKIVDAAENIVTAITSCGHINRQHHNEKNELEDLACTLPKDHKGDHGAEVNGRMTNWSDAAGTPVKKAR